MPAACGRSPKRQGPGSGRGPEMGKAALASTRFGHPPVRGVKSLITWSFRTRAAGKSLPSLRPCAASGIGLPRCGHRPSGRHDTLRGSNLTVAGSLHDAHRRPGLRWLASARARFTESPAVRHLAGLVRAYRGRMASPGTADQLYGESGSSEEIHPVADPAASRPASPDGQAGT
jgi:hypothetical protein